MTETMTKKRVWIDLDNAPHVPFFRPLIEEFNTRDCELIVTGRDCFETFQLVDLYNIPCQKIGRHYGKRTAMKALGLLVGVRVDLSVDSWTWGEPLSSRIGSPVSPWQARKTRETSRAYEIAVLSIIQSAGLRFNQHPERCVAPR